MSKVYIVHHDDEDGITAGAVIYEFIKHIEGSNNGITIVSVNYNTDLRSKFKYLASNDRVFFVDYSFNQNNFEYLKEILDIASDVVWIDHHKSSVELVENNVIPNRLATVIDTRYSGAYLAYLYAYGTINNLIGYDELYTVGKIGDLANKIDVPLFIKYVDDWDTWKHQLQGTIELHYGMLSVYHTAKSLFSKMFNYSPIILNKLFSPNKEDKAIIYSKMDTFCNTVMNRGTIITEYNNLNNSNDLMNNSYVCYIDILSDKYKCLVINKAGGSKLFGKLIEEYDICIAYTFNGANYTYTLCTNNNNIDCSKIASILGCIDNLGGGGHPGCAGFRSKNLLFKIGSTLKVIKALTFKSLIGKCDKSYKFEVL